MRIIDLYYLQKIIECSSITSAAYELNISQQRLSQIIHDMEEEIGISIFNRSKKGVTLTADGSEFMKHAQNILNNYQDIQEIKNHTIVQPHITVGIDRHITPEILNSILNIFKLHPEIDFSIQQKKNVFELIDALDYDKIQLALSVSIDISARDYLSTKPSSPFIKSHILNDSTMEFLLHKDNPCAKKNEVQIEDILLYPMVFDTQDSTYRHMLHMHKHINIFLETDSIDLKLACINQNFAVGFFDTITVSHIDLKKQYPNIRRCDLNDMKNDQIKLILYENTRCSYPGYSELVKQISDVVPSVINHHKL